MENGKKAGAAGCETGKTQGWERKAGCAGKDGHPRYGCVEMAKTLFFEKEDLRKKLRMFGLDEVRVAEISGTFDKHNRHIDVVSFVIMLERYGVQRSDISSFLHDIGVEESTLINIFSKADFARLGMGNREVTQVVLAD
jgi:hypothetical protein